MTAEAYPGLRARRDARRRHPQDVLANAEYLDSLIYDPLGNAVVMLCVHAGFGLYIMKIASQVEV